MRALDPPSAEKVARAARRQQQALMAVDEAVAGLVAALADTGRLSDTLIVFASDNGLLWGEHGMLDKNVPYTPATAVPLVLRWDGHVGAGQVDDRLALNIDITATLAAAGLTGMHTDGSDLLTPARRDGFVLEAAADPSCGDRRTAAGGRPTGPSCTTRPARRSSTRSPTTPARCTTSPRCRRRATSWTRCGHGPARPARRSRRASTGESSVAQHLRGHCGASDSTTDSTLPAGSVNQAMSGPPPRKMPFSSVAAGVPS